MAGMLARFLGFLCDQQEIAKAATVWSACPGAQPTAGKGMEGVHFKTVNYNYD